MPPKKTPDATRSADAKRRAYFAALDRKKKEAALTGPQKQERQKPERRTKAERTTEIAQARDNGQKAGKPRKRAERGTGLSFAEMYPGAKVPESLKDVRLYQTTRGIVAVRPEKPRAERTNEIARERKADRPAKEQARKPVRKESVRSMSDRQAGGRTEARNETERRLAHTARIARQRIEDAQRKAEQRRHRQRKEQLQRDFNRKAEDRKSTERMNAAREERRRKVEQQRQDVQNDPKIREAVEQAEKQFALEKRATAYVAERQKQQQADAIAEQRRQTDRMRRQHREQMNSLRDNESPALDRHWHAIKRIDGADQRALGEFDRQRGSLRGRFAEAVKGRRHFDGERQKIADRHEASRMKAHRDLEAFKERHFAAVRDTSHRQAKERLSIARQHRDDRRDLARAHEADRPRQIAERVQAMEKAERTEQARQKERLRDQWELSR